MHLFDLPRDDGRVIFTNSHQKKLFIHRIESKSGSVDNTAMGVGVAIPLGSFTLNGNYSNLKTKGADSATDNRSFDAYQLGANYSLSKRTSLYLLTGQFKTDGDPLKMTSLGVVHSF